MNNHWFGGALCLFYGTRCKNKRKSSSLYGTENFVFPSTRKLYSRDHKFVIFLTRRLLTQNITNLGSRLYSPMRLDDVDSLRIKYSCGARLNNCQTPGVKYFCQHSISFVKNIYLVANYLQ